MRIPINEVFLHEDLPPFVTKKFSEMRKRSYEHRTKYEEAFVENKNLYFNEIVIGDIAQNFENAFLMEKWI